MFLKVGTMGLRAEPQCFFTSEKHFLCGLKFYSRGYRRQTVKLGEAEGGEEEEE